MNGRERELAAIAHKVPDRIPADSLAIETIPELLKYTGVAEKDIFDRLGIDGYGLWTEYLGELRKNKDGTNMTPWGTVDDGLSYETTRFYPMAADISLSQVEHYNWPDVSKFSYATAMKKSAELSGKYALRGPCWTPLFDRVCDLVGMEEAMVKMYSEPDIFEAILDNVSTRTEKIFCGLMDACGDNMPIFSMGDDFATQRGMMVSPELWRKFLKPRYKSIFSQAKKRGRIVWFHSCGDITAVLPDLIDIGMDVWETVQLHTLPMTAKQLKKEYGKHMTFFGGVNTQRLPFIRPEEVKAEVKRCILDLGEGGGYICGPDHHIKPDVPPENTVALFDAIMEFREKGYTA